MKNVSLYGLLTRCLTKKELQLNQLEQKHLHPQVYYAKPIQNIGIKCVQLLLKHGTVLASRKVDCNAMYTKSDDDRFSFRKSDEEERIFFGPFINF